MAVARFPLHSCHLMFKTMNKIKTKNNLQFLCLYIPNNIDTGYPHEGRADKDSYPHDRHADKDSYPHDRHKQCIMLSL